MRKIGPYLSVPDDYVPNMQDAYETDGERGCHQFNNEAADKLKAEWPTVIAMAALIEHERDALRAVVDLIQTATKTSE